MRWAVVAVCVSMVSGCSGKPNVCITAPSLNASAEKGPDARAMADDCVHRWSYRLAPAETNLDEVAAAVTAACSDPIQRVQLLPGYTPEEVSPLSGKIQSRAERIAEAYRSLAKFRVLQARVGRCKVP
jgi:hypothetical protein